MQKLKKPALLLIVVAASFAMAGCDWLLEEVSSALAAPQGYVYDVSTGEPIVGATVRLIDTNGTVAYTDTSSATGYFTFSDVEYGTFELTATATGYAFTKKKVEVSGLSQWLPNVGGYVPGDEVFRIVVFWDRDFADVDSYLSMPAGYPGSAAVDPADFYTTTTSITDGFFPSDTAYSRNFIYHSNQQIIDGSDGTTVLAELDVDNVGDDSDQPGGPETMSVYYVPYDYGSFTYPSTTYTPVAADRSGLDITNSYAWVGTMEYWLDAWASTNTNTSGPAADDPDALLSSSTISGNAANPTVYVFDGNGVQKGYFELPQYQDIETASVLRINMYFDQNDYEWFQFLPNINAYASYSSIKSAEDDMSIFAVKGKKRD